MRTTRLGDLETRISGGTDREGGGDGPVVVLLHGFGAPGDDLVPLGRTLAAVPGTRFVFPAAPVDLGPRYMGGRAWWPVDFEERQRRIAAGVKRDLSEVPAGLDAARTAIDAFLEDALRTLAPASGKLVLGGFSQGAMLAFDTALREARPLAGVVMLSGTHIAADEWAARFEARRGLPVFMSHGQTDEVLPFAVSDALRATLLERGFPVDWVPFRGGHGIPGNVVDGVSRFLERVLAPG
jgi:phospholipase/carboxylesterase